MSKRKPSTPAKRGATPRRAKASVAVAMVAPAAPAPPVPTLPKDLEVGAVIAGEREELDQLVVYKNDMVSSVYLKSLTKTGIEKDHGYVSSTTPFPIRQNTDLTPWKSAIVKNQSIISRNGVRITLGADPEVFVVDAEGTVIPAFTFLPGKEKPNKDAWGTQFYDGFQAEWTTALSSGNQQCLSYHADHVQSGMKAVLAAARVKFPEARLSIASAVPIPPEMVHRYDERHFQLGCSPSKNAYDEEPLVVDDPMALPFRSAGWHMHMGLGGSYESGPDRAIPEEKIRSAVRMMDAVLGVVGVTFGQEYQYPERRTLYGRAGEYRYGTTLEYRVPEVLMGAHPATWNLLWDLGRMAMWLGLRGLNFLWDAKSDEVRHAINKLDGPLALKILKRNEKMLVNMLERIYYFDKGDGKTSHTLDTIYNGIAEAVTEPTNMEKNWCLGDKQSWIAHNGVAGTTWTSACNIWAVGKNRV